MSLSLAVALAAFAQPQVAGRPFADHHDSRDLRSAFWYQSAETNEDDPALGEMQRRITIHSHPVWYAGADCVVRPIDTTVSETIDLGTGARGFGNATNILCFVASESGDAVYHRNGHRLRIRMQEVTSDSANKEFAPFIERAKHPSALTANASRVVMDGIIPDVTIEHIVLPGRVKELVAITRGPATADTKTVRYTWRCASDLSPALTRRGIEWRDGTDTIFTIEPPVAWDTNGSNVPCSYGFCKGLLSVEFDAADLRGAEYPVVLDPTISTDQNAAVFNRSIGSSDLPGWNHAYAQVALPDLTAEFLSIDSATFTATGSSGWIGVYADAACDVARAWNESSSAGDLEALRFSAATDESVLVNATSPNTFDILGAIGVNGIARIYADDPSPANATIRLTWTNALRSNNQAETGLRLGFADGPGNERVTFHPRTAATNCWRVEIVYTSASRAGTPPTTEHGP